MAFSLLQQPVCLNFAAVPVSFSFDLSAQRPIYWSARDPAACSAVQDMRLALKVLCDMRCQPTSPSRQLGIVVQAMIAFEEDVPPPDTQRLQQQVREIGDEVQQALATASKGRLLKAGLQVSFCCSAVIELSSVI